MSWPHNQKAPQLSPSSDSAFPRIGCLLSQPTSVSVRDGHPGSRLLFFPLTAEEGVHVPRTAPAQVPGPALRSATVSLPTLHQALCAACTLSLEPAAGEYFKLCRPEGLSGMFFFDFFPTFKKRKIFSLRAARHFLP